MEEREAALSGAARLVEGQLEKEQVLTEDLRRLVAQMTNSLSASFQRAEESWERTAEVAEDIRETVELMQKSRARR